MPPEQCPACGRFLAAAFVRAANHTPRPCPGCEADLQVDPGASAPSVRALAVSADAHPLDTWDRGPTPMPTVDDRGGVVAPEQLAAVGLAGVLGAALAGRGRRVHGAALAAVVALVLSVLRD